MTSTPFSCCPLAAFATVSVTHPPAGTTALVIEPSDTAVNAAKLPPPVVLLVLLATVERAPPAPSPCFTVIVA